jgi:hypothetical protein
MSKKKKRKEVIVCNKFCPIQERSEGMARHEEFEDESPQEDCAKTRRAI